jgi:hypothetical protein
MKYKNTIIYCKKEKTEELQKYLFRLKYHWYASGIKNRIIRHFNYDVCIIIRNDRSLTFTTIRVAYTNFTDFTCVTYPVFIRKEKLEKLNKNQKV